MMDKRVLWITRTAVSVALLVTLQAVTRPLGQYVTGSTVNLILILCASLFGVSTGAAVGLISPFFAFLFGIGPGQLLIIPFQALGNITISVVWGFLSNYKKGNPIVRHITALVAGAGLKTAVLYVGVVLIAIPLIPGLNEQQAATMSTMFSIPQLITASIGGAVALIVLPLVRKAVKPLRGGE